MHVRGKTFKHCRCELCGRDFVEDVESAEQYAVNASTFDFVRLDDEVSGRWLSEPCPTRRLDSDAPDRLKLRRYRGVCGGEGSIAFTRRPLRNV